MAATMSIMNARSCVTRFGKYGWTCSCGARSTDDVSWPRANDALAAGRRAHTCPLA